jgi:hypothetical protein
MSCRKDGNRLAGQGPFLCLLTVIGLLLSGAAFVLWWVPSVGLTHIHPRLPFWFGLVLAVLLAVVLSCLLLLALTLVSGRDLFFSPRLGGLMVKYLLPAVIGVGTLFGIDRDVLQRSFIALNNQLVRGRKLRVRADQMLILLPHCLQLFDCAIKVTGDVENCARCGRCDIGDLAKLASRRGVAMAVATGGTLARKILMEKRPRLVVAVACERDLTSGIRDAYPLPVIGVYNNRPEGPCFNTRVDLAAVEQALDEHLLP